MPQIRRSLIYLSHRVISQQQQRCVSSHSAHLPTLAHSVNEPLGRRFWVTLAAVPLFFALYKFSLATDGGEPAITRMITYYSNLQQKWLQRNTTHTFMIEQAAFDRNLFQSTPASEHIDLKFPEIFNTGSPFNVPAGHTVNLDKVIAHYHQQNENANKAREARNKVATGIAQEE